MGNIQEHKSSCKIILSDSQFSLENNKKEDISAQPVIIDVFTFFSISALETILTFLCFSDKHLQKRKQGEMLLKDRMITWKLVFVDV